MKYVIDCVWAGQEWQYRVTLWCGSLQYYSARNYKRRQDAIRAAKATGATPKHSDKFADTPIW